MRNFHNNSVVHEHNAVVMILDYQSRIANLGNVIVDVHMDRSIRCNWLHTNVAITILVRRCAHMNMFMFVVLMMHMHFERESWWAIASPGCKCG